jgi:hypothetical protein
MQFMHLTNVQQGNTRHDDTQHNYIQHNDIVIMTFSIILNKVQQALMFEESSS